MKPTRNKNWGRIRGSYISKHLYCEECEAPAVDVHHIIAVSKGGSDDDSNLQSLCAECHEDKTFSQRVENNQVYLEIGDSIIR